MTIEHSQQIAKSFDDLRAEIRGNHEELRCELRKVNTTLNGKEGSAGVVTRVALLEQSEAQRRTHNKLLWGGVITAISGMIANFLRGGTPTP